MVISTVWVGLVGTGSEGSEGLEAGAAREMVGVAGSKVRVDA